MKINDILKISDSPYKENIEKFLNTIRIKDTLIHAAFTLNAATLLAAFLLGFNVSIDAVMIYIAASYFFIGLSLFYKFYIHKKSIDKILHYPVLEILDDCSFLLAVPIVFFLDDFGSIDIVVYLVLGALFVTSFFSIKYIHNYLMAKAVVYTAVVAFIFLDKQDTLSLIYTVFSLTTVYILLNCLACWIYVRQIRLYHFSASYLDVSETSKKMHSDLSELKEKRDQLLRHIGHDLRQSVNAVNYALFNVQVKPLDEMQKSQVKNALSSVADANAMIESMLNLSLNQVANQLVVNHNPLLLSDLLHAVFVDFQGVAEREGCTLCFIPSAVVVVSDEVLLARILKNFVSNAISHSGSDRIVMGVRRREAGIDIQVVDRGKGIGSDFLTDIFEESVSKQKLPSEANLGLGLSAARQLAHMLGAKVSIQSEVGKGTVCALHIPSNSLHS